ncbi:MotA/TolQ/ExbB proton channel family protein [bacterium]|nr:MotA/TolQ/ExbB proton channel family protein [bacterium]
MGAIVDLTAKGGFMMGPLYLTAVVCLFFIIERIQALWKFHQREAAFLADVESDGLGAAAARAGDFGPARVIAGGRGVDATLAELTAILERDLGRFLHGLAAIYKGAPLMGLLGATLGIIKVFRKLSVQGLEQMEYFAGGISEVLVTTATGLLIAIPALFFTFYLNGLVARKISQYETLYLTEIERGR